MLVKKDEIWRSMKRFVGIGQKKTDWFEPVSKDPILFDLVSFL